MDGYQALLLVSFGGPERAEDVKPFLSVTAGRMSPKAASTRSPSTITRLAG